jgi:hypothetical protein
VVHQHLDRYRIAAKKEWFRAPRQVIVEGMTRFRAIHDVVVGKRDYRVIEGKYLVLNCMIGKDDYHRDYKRDVLFVGESIFMVPAQILETIWIRSTG